LVPCRTLADEVPSAAAQLKKNKQTTGRHQMFLNNQMKKED
jgi:hypothetical protein